MSRPITEDTFQDPAVESLPLLRTRFSNTFTWEFHRCHRCCKAGKQGDTCDNCGGMCIDVALPRTSCDTQEMDCIFLFLKERILKERIRSYKFPAAQGETSLATNRAIVSHEGADEDEDSRTTNANSGQKRRRKHL